MTMIDDLLEDVEVGIEKARRQNSKWYGWLRRFVNDSSLR